MPKRWRKRLIFLVIATLLFVAAFYNDLTLREYTLDSIKINEKITIVLISDLHSYIFGDRQQRLLTKIIDQQPDLILLAGDIVDNVYPVLGSQLFLEGIQNLCPVYYVTGNHEYWAASVDDIRDMLTGHGVTILSDNYEYIEINGSALIIAGVEDPDKGLYEDPSYNQEEAMRLGFANLPEDGYRILLAHRPERIASYLPFGFDLIVSGHAHGGQVRIPMVLNGLLAPHQGWFPPYAGGLYQHGATTHIVSRGVSFNPRLPRIFNPPEIVVIRLR